MKICVIGGGIAGLTVAYALSRLGYCITVINASGYSQYTAGEHLAAGALQELKTLGIPAYIWEETSIPCYEIQSSWGEASFSYQDSILNPYGQGVLLSRPAFDKKLLEFIRQNTNIRLKINTRVIDIQKQDNKWEVKYTNQSTQTIRTDFIIDASGRNTKFPSRLDSKKLKYDDLIGITLLQRNNNARDHFSHKGAISIDATPKGWWYKSTLSDDTVVSTFLTDADIAKEDGSIKSSLESFIKLSTSVSDDSMQYTSQQKIHISSAKTQILSKLASEDWLAVGDAAWSADPLSSQGLSKAIKNSKNAAIAINRFFSSEKDALRLYEENCKKEFYAYLQNRFLYYKMEKRWKDETFWKRRRQSNWLNTKIDINPAAKISIGIEASSDVINVLKYTCPSINFPLLLTVLQSSETALEAVDSYKRAASDTKPETREVIIAIQRLIDQDEKPLG